MELPYSPLHAELRIAGLVLCLSACHPPPETTSSPPAPATVCYTLTFARWEPITSSPFFNAPVGLVAPLPDTVVLTRNPIRARSGPARYQLTRRPQSSEQSGATWSPVAPGVLVLRFPEAAGQGLIVTLKDDGLQLDGRAGVYLDERPSDLIRLTPATNVKAARIPCPLGLRSLKPGA
jgi:hypothetical protein